MPKRKYGIRKDTLGQSQSPISAASSNPDSPRFAPHFSSSQPPRQMSLTSSSTFSPVLPLQEEEDLQLDFCSNQDPVQVDGNLNPMPVIQELVDDGTRTTSGQDADNELKQALKKNPRIEQRSRPPSSPTTSPVLPHETSIKQTPGDLQDLTCIEFTQGGHICNKQSSKTQDPQNNIKNKALIDNLIEITKTYQSHLKTQKAITTHDEKGKLAEKVRIIEEILAQLNEVTDSDKLEIFRERLKLNKDSLSKHRTEQGERYLQLASIICFSAIAIAVPAITISLEIGLVMLAATLALIAAVSIYQKVETNSWNFFAPRGQLYCEQAERHLPSCS